MPSQSDPASATPDPIARLREQMLHPTEYVRALDFFFDEIGENDEFIDRSEPHDDPVLAGALEQFAGSVAGHEVRLRELRVLRLNPEGLCHGSASVDGGLLVFFYFEELQTGVAAFTRGLRARTEIGRFQVRAGSDPRKN